MRSIYMFCFMAILGAVLGNAVAEPVFVDNFNDNSLNTSVWQVKLLGVGPIITEQNGRLEITFPSGCVNDPQTGAFQIGIYTNWKLRGDYDIQVDYRCMYWPYGNGTHIALDAATCPARLSGGTDRPEPREMYENGSANAATDHTSGKLRQVKIIHTVTGYYMDDDENWVPLLSQGTSGDVGVNLRAWNHEVSFYAPVKIAFDNFIVNKGEIVTEEVVKQ